MESSEIKEHLLSPAYYLTAGLFALVIIIFLTVFLPSLRRIEQISNSINAERYELEKLYTRGQLVHEVKIKLEQIKKDLPLIEKTILRAGGELEWIKGLESRAQSHSLEQRINLGTASQENGIQVIPFTLQVAGDWRDVLAYVRDLERLDWYLKMSGIEVNAVKDPATKSNPTGRVMAIIRISTYWQ